jgi:hypothetical protein
MKRNLLLAYSVFFLTACCLGKTAQSPEQFLEKLYTSDHVPMLDLGINFTNREALSKFFDSELTDLFIKDNECTIREQGTCNLNADPIYDAQDYDDETTGLKISQVDGEVSQFAVTFTNISTRTLIYKLKNTKEGWRISDIKYPEGPSLKEQLSYEIKY